MGRLSDFGPEPRSILPRFTGEGDRRRRWRGRPQPQRSRRLHVTLSLTIKPMAPGSCPLHHAAHGPPPPLRRGGSLSQTASAISTLARCFKPEGDVLSLESGRHRERRCSPQGAKHSLRRGPPCRIASRILQARRADDVAVGAQTHGDADHQFVHPRHVAIQVPVRRHLAPQSRQLRAGGARSGSRSLLPRSRTAPVRRRARRPGQGVQIKAGRGPGRRRAGRRGRRGSRRCRRGRTRLLSRGRCGTRRRGAGRRRGRRPRRRNRRRRPRRRSRRHRGRTRRGRGRRRLRRNRLGRRLDRGGGPVLGRGLCLRIVGRRGGDDHLRHDRHRHRVHQRLGLVHLGRP